MRLVSDAFPVDGAPDMVQRWQVGGVVLVGSVHEPMLEALRVRGMAYVLLFPKRDVEHNGVICDDYRGMLDCLETLRQQGCVHFVFAIAEIPHVLDEKRVVDRQHATTVHLVRDPNPLEAILAIKALPIPDQACVGFIPSQTFAMRVY